MDLRSFRSVLVLSAVLPFVVACGGDESPTYGDTNQSNGDGGEEQTSGLTIQMTGDGYGSYSFSPASDTVSVGDTVTWSDQSGIAHTVSSDDDVWDSGDIPADGSFERVFESTGEFPYHCSYHGEAGGVDMAGTLVVEE